MSVPPQELETTWDGVRVELRRAVTDLAFHLWLDPLELVGRERDMLYVRAPRHIRTLVEERYLPLLRAAAERALAVSVAVSVVGEEWAGEPPHAGAGTMPGRPRAAGIDSLNPAYTFDRFVIGEGNRLAHAASLAVAEQPAQAFNPLFLHGAPGLGKTHLLHAVGNYLRSFGRGVSVRYATSDEFTSAFVGAVRGGGIEDFKREFRQVDVLLVDDVQFLAARSRTQEEFFHTFNALYEAGCQLVVSSDRPPREMTTFERRLAERFGSGLVVALDAPDLEARLAILRKRSALNPSVTLSEEALLAVARYVTGSVRALEGALIRVTAYGSLRGEPLTPDLCRRVLQRLYPAPAAPSCAITDVKNAVAVALSVPLDTLDARDRRPTVALARQVAMYLARELTGSSLPEIGSSFGGRNHSTVLHAHRQIALRRQRDPETAELVDKVKAGLTEPDRSE